MKTIEFAETRGGAVVRLHVGGELDLATARDLEERLDALRAEGAKVRLNLSKVEFIDLSGVRVIARALTAPGHRGSLALEPELSRSVRRLFELVKFDPLRRGGLSPAPNSATVTSYR